MEWSAPEFILLFVIALIVLGPERMAQVAKKIGQFVGYARRMSRNLQVQLEDELEMKQIRDSLPSRVDLGKEMGLDGLKEDIDALSAPIEPSDSEEAAPESDTTTTDTSVDDAEPPAAQTAVAATQDTQS